MKKKHRILDYGGGEGQLLLPFVDMGHECYLVDYSKKYFSGIIKFGDDILDIPEEEKFDIIICSHVLEHLVEPQTVLSQLRSHLSRNGFIYIEVPHQIWAGISCIGPDPTTHINFFTQKSLEYLLQKSQFLICKSGQNISNHGQNFIEIIFLIAKANEENNAPVFPKPDVIKFLYPSRKYSLKRFLLPQFLKIKSSFVRQKNELKSLNNFHKTQ